VPRRRDHLFRAALGHVLEFATWLSLTAEHSLAGDEAIGIAVDFVNAAADASMR
jgi:hypothetical protein